MIINIDFFPVAVVYNGEMYVFGGFNGVHNIHFADMHKFNPSE